MKTVLLSLSYIAGIAEVLLGIYFAITNSKNEIRRVLSTLFIATGLWAIVNALTAYVEPSHFIDIALDLSFVFGIVIVTVLLHFCMIFPNRTRIFDKLHVVLLYIPAFIFSVTTFLGGSIIDGYEVSTSTAGFVNPGPVYALYQISVSALFFIALIVLARKTNYLDGINKENNRIVLTSLALGGTPAIATILSYVFIGPKIDPLYASVFSMLWVAGPAYIILKKS